MTKNISSIARLSLLAAAFVALSVLSGAEGAGTNAPASSDQPAVKPGKHGNLPFHGNLSAVDLKAMTLTVGTLTLHVTAETTIIRDGKSATLADGVVGEPVSGAYKKTSDGKLNATSIHFASTAENKKKEASGAGGND